MKIKFSKFFQDDCKRADDRLGAFGCVPKEGFARYVEAYLAEMSPYALLALFQQAKETMDFRLSIDISSLCDGVCGCVRFCPWSIELNLDDVENLKEYLHYRITMKRLEGEQ